MASNCYFALLHIFLFLSISINVYQYYPWTGEELESQAIGTSDTLPHRQDWPLEELAGSVSRILSSSDTSSIASNSDSGHHRPHQHYALLFLFNSILVGTALLHLNHYFRGMQVTVVLFMVGLITSIILEGLELYESFGIFGDSYKMWLDIDPHLLLFTMLPVLLAGDAMTIDTQIANRVALQCLYLAGPGVIFCSFATAAFLTFYLDWSWLLSLTTGSILCATDPVAVVALLKELDASPILTVQIQGESLLNDGTAIVLYTVAYNMLSGEDYDTADIATFLVRTAMMGAGLGVCLGYFFLSWMCFSSNRFNRHCDKIQILLTLCAAYWSFVLAEGVLEMSGVLATVSSSLVLAHYMWPHVVSTHSMHNFWETIESLGTIIIFVLGGALCGAAMVKIKPVNYFYLIVLYIFLTIVRGVFLFASVPVLGYLSPDRRVVSWQDATVMTWGGLRGAVGLALAIRVSSGRATNQDGVPQVETEDAQLVLFFVSGVAFLTTIVNATTAPWLVQWLGITKAPETQLKLMMKFNQSLLVMADQDDVPSEVMAGLRAMILNIEKNVGSLRGTPQLKKSRRLSLTPMEMPILKTHITTEPPAETIEMFLNARKSFLEYTAGEKAYLSNLGELPQDMLIDRRIKDGEISLLDHCVNLLQEFPTVNAEFATVVNKAFLSLVRNGYQRLIGISELRPGSAEATVLSQSVNVALSVTDGDLDDYSYIVRQFGVQELDGDEHLTVFKSKRFTGLPELGAFGRWMEGYCFNLVIIVMIVINCIYVFIEENVRSTDNQGNIIWLIIELFFVTVFTVEFLLKFVHLRMEYFKDSWNVFDFILMLLGLISGLTAIFEFDADDAVPRQTQFIRLARVLRSVRFLRAIRIWHASLTHDDSASPEMDKWMTQIAGYSSFAAAHVQAQVDLFQYFCGGDLMGQEDDVEFARCFLQSQTSVYAAWSEIINVQKNLDVKLLEAMQQLYEKKHITERLEKYVDQAQRAGAINNKQAKIVLHPLREQITGCLHRLHQAADGIVRDSIYTNRGDRGDSIAPMLNSLELSDALQAAQSFTVMPSVLESDETAVNGLSSEATNGYDPPAGLQTTTSVEPETPSELCGDDATSPSSSVSKPKPKGRKTKKTTKSADAATVGKPIRQRSVMSQAPLAGSAPLSSDCDPPMVERNPS